MANIPWLREDSPNPDTEILRRLKFWVDTIPAPPPAWKKKEEPLREPDPREPFRARLDQAMYGKGSSLEGVVAVIVNTLEVGNAESRWAAAGLLGCVANAIAETSAPVTSNILGALTALIEALKSEQDYGVCDAEIDALVHFAPHDGVRVVRALVEFAKEAKTQPKLRQRALVTLRKCVGAVVSLVMGELLSLLEDSEVVIQRETCMTLGALAEDGVTAIPALEKVVLRTNQPSVQREAARALVSLYTHADNTKVFADLVDLPLRTQVLGAFASIGDEGSDVLRGLVLRWGKPPVDREPTTSAVGIEPSAETALTDLETADEHDRDEFDADVVRVLEHHGIPVARCSELSDARKRYLIWYGMHEAGKQAAEIRDEWNRRFPVHALPKGKPGTGHVRTGIRRAQQWLEAQNS